MDPRSTADDPPASTADELLALHRAGALVGRYPDVRALLTDLPGPALARAGQWLARLDPDEVLRAHPDTPTVTVAVTGNATLGPLAAPLTGELARHGLLARTLISDFNGYLADLSDPASDVYSADPDLVLAVLDAAVVFDQVTVPWRPEDVRHAFDTTLSLLEKLVIRFGETARGALVLNTIPLPRASAAQLVDHRGRARLGAIWRAANERLLRLADVHPFVVVLDLDTLIAEGIPVTDARLAMYAKARLSPELLARYAREIGHLARHVTGRTKKVLAVDLDDTVWGGLVGEDGVEGIEVADSYRGEAFQAFQQTLRQLAAQGVLLAAVSKNDLEPVRAALREHPRITVRENDFVRVVANWRPKHENLAELATDLNVGADSVVFVDDSPYERGLVRRELSDVAVVAVDGEPAHHVERLLRDGWFDVLQLTAEDRARPARYQDELARKDFLHSFDSLNDYLNELDVRVLLARAEESEIPRISQLTLRTNQFNLTTQRLQPADVRALADHPNGYVLAVHASDRFGDNGIVGAVLAHRERTDDGAELRIDNFLLSCRVFARGIEQATLAALLRHARDIGATAVTGEYRRTAKNDKVREFYPRAGFVTVTDDGATATFRHKTTDRAEIAAPPEHVRLTVRLARTGEDQQGDDGHEQH
ncbi:MAG TPA: HAD-IIIC family phosphatase [Pseudonocardiaceae bacterium]|nr:HAD-IIIC family phosphatase [Pseudonocardiaceae bacterium]